MNEPENPISDNAANSVMPLNQRSAPRVRHELIRALRLDLVGPEPARFSEDSQYAAERLPMRPSRWYLTGFLVPRETPEEEKSDEGSQEEIDGFADDKGSADEDTATEKSAARRVFLPSSIGLSVLVPAGSDTIKAVVRWGDYSPEARPPGEDAKTGDRSEGQASADGQNREEVRADEVWRRTGYEQGVVLPLPKPKAKPTRVQVPDSNGLWLYAYARPADFVGSRLIVGTQSVAVFLVNERTPGDKESPDTGYVFQASVELHCDAGFLGRPDPRRGTADDWDERVADLQYADTLEYATGHNIACSWDDAGGTCTRVWTTWQPCAEVPFTSPSDIAGVMRGMEQLAAASEQELEEGLNPLVARYAEWIAARRSMLPVDPERRKTAEDLLARADRACARMADGIALLKASDVRRAFQLANAAMADAARHRDGARVKQKPETVNAPTWRPFQLAFFLLNLRGIAEPTHDDREIVDLLFFPTGGGKTEAYLGLAAFTLALRRLRNEGVRGAGVSVLMRYTLRLLTLDQLGRATALICALERLRVAYPGELGDWPFEIGLWVGKAATPLRMGRKGDQRDDTARARTLKFKQGKGGSPLPMETCPWCGTEFTKDSFHLRPNADNPGDLAVLCANPDCDFTGDRPLPLIVVDEPLYRRLPCFVIATVDKFAGLPFEERAGALFGHVDRHDAAGFYGASDPGIGTPIPGGSLLPPDLVIQDELHLISGPLGTIAGLYETAIDHFASRKVGDARIRPKIVASTATVRRAESQCRALFARKAVELFPPASPDRRDTFFAVTASPGEVAPREYVGVAAPGRSLRVVMLRTYVALLAASMKAYLDNGGDAAAKAGTNPADPYLSLLGYFNALRELGGARRIVEGEVIDRVRAYADRRRVGEAVGLFANRDIAYEVMELTSRVSTTAVSQAKKRLEQTWLAGAKDRSVDVALATNMISVGLDITRLGLMVVLGQPKGSAEYIQSTSRVGRDPNRPGLVVTLLSVNKPRDRSHYERFAFYHRTFYRSVEATSVTPFAPRAIDRVLPALVVALARHGLRELTPAAKAIDVEALRPRLDFVSETLATRVTEHDPAMDSAHRDALRTKIRGLAEELLDMWSTFAHNQSHAGAALKYQPFEKVDSAKPLLRDPLDRDLSVLPKEERAFRAARSMRDVEPEVVLIKRGRT